MLAFVDPLHAAPCPRCCSCLPAIFRRGLTNVRASLRLSSEHHPFCSVLELLWALGSLLASFSVPFPKDGCRALFKNLLQYIDSSHERYTMHALLCCLDAVLARLSALPAADASAAHAAAADSLQHMDDKLLTIKTILKLLTHVRLCFCAPF